MGNRSSRLVAAALGIAIAGVAVPAPAEAFTQTWEGSADYRASKDFVPSESQLSVRGMSCNGFAFRVQLHESNSGQAKAWQSPPQFADGTWYQWDGVPADTNTVYHLRFYSSFELPTPCQGLGAFPTAE